mgnify:CR=1 FL=1|jgi:hypothetical protein
MPSTIEDDHVDARPDLGDVLDGYEGHSYKIWDAIAELVDNSVDSYFKNGEQLKAAGRKNFQIIISLNNKERKLVVHDDAFGMSKAELSRAVLVAKKNTWGEGIGKYGLGLKTACSWFGKKWTVATKQLGSDFEYTATVDIKKLLKENSNKIPITVKPVMNKKNQSYTTITVEDGIRTYGTSSIAKAKTTLGIMYQKYLSQDRLKLKFQFGSKTEYLGFAEPNILVTTDPGNDDIVHDFKIDAVHEKTGLKITGRYGIYPPQRIQTAYSGVTCFWRDRVIIRREKNAFWPKCTIKNKEYNLYGAAGDLKRQRFFVHLNLDMDPTSLKDDFKWDIINQDDLSKFLVEYENGHIFEQAQLAHDLRTNNDDEVSAAQKDSDDLDLSTLLESDEMADALTLVDSIIEEEEIELTEEDVKKLEVGRPAVETKINNGQPTLFFQESDSMHESERFMKLVHYPNERKIKCFVNTKHPFYKRHIEIHESSYSAYKRMITAIALAEWSTKSRDPPVGPASFIKVVDNYLKGKSAMQ